MPCRGVKFFTKAPMTLFKRILSSALLVCSLSPLQSALAAPVVYALEDSTSTLLTVDIA